MLLASRHHTSSQDFLLCFFVLCVQLCAHTHKRAHVMLLKVAIGLVTGSYDSACHVFTRFQEFGSCHVLRSLQ